MAPQNVRWIIQLPTHTRRLRDLLLDYCRCTGDESRRGTCNVRLATLKWADFSAHGGKSVLGTRPPHGCYHCGPAYYHADDLSFEKREKTLGAPARRICTFCSDRSRTAGRTYRQANAAAGRLRRACDTRATVFLLDGQSCRHHVAELGATRGNNR